MDHGMDASGLTRFTREHKHKEAEVGSIWWVNVSESSLPRVTMSRFWDENQTLNRQKSKCVLCQTLDHHHQPEVLPKL